MSVPANFTPEPTIILAQTAWRQLFRSRFVCAGSLLIGFLALLGVFAPVLARHDPTAQLVGGLDAEGRPLPPSPRFPLGTDDLGRDVFSRSLYGIRISLLMGVAAMLTATLVGVAVGLTAGYCGGWTDAVLMRFTDVMLAIPGPLLAIAFAGLMDGREVNLHVTWLPFPPLGFRLGRGLVSILLVIGFVSWTTMARVVRVRVLELKRREFVDAARVIGCSHWRIIMRHILPNVLPTIIAFATLSTAGTILLESGLAFLSVGLPPPTPSLGRMIADGQPFLVSAPWLVLAPGIAVVLVALGFNLLGQGLQDVLDPRHGMDSV